MSEQIKKKTGKEELRQKSEEIRQKVEELQLELVERRAKNAERLGEIYYNTNLNLIRTLQTEMKQLKKIMAGMFVLIIILLLITDVGKYLWEFLNYLFSLFNQANPGEKLAIFAAIGGFFAKVLWDKGKQRLAKKQKDS